MYKVLTVIVRLFLALPVMVATWLVSFFILDNSYWFSSAIALGGAVLTYLVGSAFLHFRFLKKHQLSMKEYRYIRKNLDEASKKIRRMQKALLSIRQMRFLKEIFELVRIVRRVQGVTKKEPKRFYMGEKFYFSHLDSAVELTEKYALLASQPSKNSDVEQVLDETRQTIIKVKANIEKDLYHILSDDIDQLNFELDVAKFTTK
jgi:5-bromo-4-chloroindolyl phosphate hydrolysis protein